MFQRIGSAAYKANLDNTISICNILNNPQNNFPSIHVAGTNGKGSTSHMIASIFQEQGYKTGLYTSPHLKDFRERIKINGEMISENYIIDFVEEFRIPFEKIEPSFFEWTVGLAFKYFSDNKVDIAVIETGLGGRLDSTNIITPVLSVITNISLDHQNLLGETIEKIAAEKAGIIKQGVPVVIGETQVETEKIFKERAKALEAPIFFADGEFRVENIKIIRQRKAMLRCDVHKNNTLYTESLLCGLPGLYQQKNIITVLKSVELLQSQFPVLPNSIKEGIKNVVENTGLLGRWQTISEAPLIICDTGHNEAGIKEVLKQISLTPHEKLHFILGLVNDKDVNQILMLLPKNAHYYFTKAQIPRALNQEELKREAEKAGLSGKSYDTVKKAIDAARAKATSKDLIFIGGSTFTVAEAL